MKKRIVSLLVVVCSAVVLCGCNREDEADYHYTWSITKESDTWKLEDYVIEIVPMKLTAGRGTLQMKNTEEYNTDFFNFDTYVVHGNKKRRIHSKSVSGAAIDIAEEKTGNIEEDTSFYNNDSFLTAGDINAIYMMIEWWDTEQEEIVKEKIPLYSGGAGN
ncbi:hypothetical protein [Salibacterium aidingense]|uniref:hypothetical protein n=1 Tax=Salibacterium aidingense TaxID=384933 RepID=UPI003BD78F40